MSNAHLPAAPICSRRKLACWWSTAPRLTASTASMKPSPSQPLPPTSRWSKARWSRRSNLFRSGSRRGCATPRWRRPAAVRCGSRLTSSTALESARQCCPGRPRRVVEKPLRITAERLAPAGATIMAERRVPHDEAALAAAIKELLGLGAELVIVFGASAIADRRDVIPAAITGIGGAIEHFGMPVDPGNLLLIGNAGGVPVLGAPGCARSPVENGFDWVLMRLLAGLKVTRAELTGMGVGGLLMEIVTRPQPRENLGTDANRNVAAIILAAGRSTRMGGPNKLLAELGGKPLVRIVTEQALASKAQSVIVVTGHQAEQVEKALQGLNVKFVRNPDFAEGLASSVKAGIAAVPANADGAVICLGDMPLISAHLVDRLIEAFAPDRGNLIAVPVSDNRRGNPVLWSGRFFN